MKCILPDLNASSLKEDVGLGKLLKTQTQADEVRNQGVRWELSADMI